MNFSPYGRHCLLSSNKNLAQYFHVILLFNEASSLATKYCTNPVDLCSNRSLRILLGYLQYTNATWVLIVVGLGPTNSKIYHQINKQ